MFTNLTRPFITPAHAERTLKAAEHTDAALLPLQARGMASGETRLPFGGLALTAGERSSSFISLSNVPAAPMEG